MLGDLGQGEGGAVVGEVEGGAGSVLPLVELAEVLAFFFLDGDGLAGLVLVDAFAEGDLADSPIFGGLQADRQAVGQVASGAGAALADEDRAALNRQGAEDRGDAAADGGSGRYGLLRLPPE